MQTTFAVLPRLGAGFARAPENFIAMNHGISILFRAIPLAMAAFCFAYGAYIFSAGTDTARLTAGPVVFYLGAICVALYCTAATIIRQIIGTYTAAAKYLFPATRSPC